MYTVNCRSHIRRAARSCAALVKTLLVFLTTQCSNAHRTYERSLNRRVDFETYFYTWDEVTSRSDIYGHDTTELWS